MSDPVAGSLMRAACNIAQARASGSPAATVGHPVKEIGVLGATVGHPMKEIDVLAAGMTGVGIGVFTTRVFSAFIDEGACMLAEGIEPALIENAAKQAGMPVGPLAQFDEVSQELSWKIIQHARARQAAAGVIEKMIALNRRGRRFGGGFYEYPQGGRKFLWPALREHFPIRSEQPTVAELKSRLLAIQALEAARCLEEGVIECPQDADVASMLSIDYPRWTGGVLSYIDVLGLPYFVDQCARFAMHYGPRYEPSAWLRARAIAGERFYPRAQAS
jgi:3-hydroxyacyl-CoA dehydrogenase/enoyl-CoA hydratase/3-hydroxybutyryl-CoA epimerase